jgi:hypothetical protein
MTRVLPASFNEREEKFEDEYTNLLSSSASVWADAATKGIATLDVITRSPQEWAALSDRARAILGGGIQQLESLRKATEQRHHLYQGIFYCSFGLGWLVGLASSPAGGKAPSAET